MTPRSRSLISAASATPVCGQLNMPAHARAAHRHEGPSHFDRSASSHTAVHAATAVPSCAPGPLPPADPMRAGARAACLRAWRSMDSPYGSFGKCLFGLYACVRL